MTFLNFLKKKPSRTEVMEGFERVLLQTTRWKYRGIQRIYLYEEYGKIFLKDILINKEKSITLTDLKIWGNKLRKQDKVFSRREIEELSRQAGFDVWEAFDWEKEHAETIKNISTIALTA